MNEKDLARGLAPGGPLAPDGDVKPDEFPECSEFSDSELLTSAIAIQEALETLNEEVSSAEARRKHIPAIFPENSTHRTKKMRFEKRLDLPDIVLPLSENAPCVRCNRSIDYDLEIYTHFGILVCRPCKAKSLGDQGDGLFQLIPKTRVKEAYLLTDDDLQHPEKLPFIEKQNPKLPTWHPMHLYLRYQIEQLAIKKFGSLENIDKERENRVDTTVKRKEKKIQGKATRTEN